MSIRFKTEGELQQEIKDGFHLFKPNERKVIRRLMKHYIIDELTLENHVIDVGGCEIGVLNPQKYLISIHYHAEGKDERFLMEIKGEN